MYDTYAQWRNEIRAAQKALRLMKEAYVATNKLQRLHGHLYLLHPAIDKLEHELKQEEALLKSEQAA